ncbi:luciferase domain-containing protein [Phycicoccus flavus]|uniref:Phospholipase n=1 Tax=Phycicoccus flavus TaxID=2502783 RepID=A0A8T6R4G6_9MICO|nr:luciferase family protein [Phycicoccus flavus]NHA67685.1 phospholipase [Phycicoccus flavus]
MVADVPLPTRAGVRPRTTTCLPHSQLDQQPEDDGVLTAVLDRAGSWPHVGRQPSRIAVPGSRALVVTSEGDVGPPEAFMVGREFCHGHAGGDHSLHVTLPVEVARAATLAGWAEPHYLVHEGQAPPTVVMLYAPRDDEEQSVVRGLVRRSYEFALTGE